MDLFSASPRWIRNAREVDGNHLHLASEALFADSVADMIINPGGASVGGTVGTVATSATALPLLSNGTNPKWVYICITRDTSVSALMFTLGGSGVTSDDEPIPTEPTSTTGIGVSSGGPGIILNVAGRTHYRVIATDAGSMFTVTPLAGVYSGG